MARKYQQSISQSTCHKPDSLNLLPRTQCEGKRHSLRTVFRSVSLASITNIYKLSFKWINLKTINGNMSAYQVQKPGLDQFPEHQLKTKQTEDLGWGKIL